MDLTSLSSFRDELSKIAAEKDSGFLDTIKQKLTTPIAGTPELFGGVKNSIEHATRGGGAGGGPSADFLKFQKQRAMQTKTSAFLDELAKIGGLFPVPAVPLVNPGMNVVFAAKPRTISQPVQPVK